MSGDPRQQLEESGAAADSNFSDSEPGAGDPCGTHIYVDVAVVDSAGTPLANEPYRLTLPDGSALEGELDGNGVLRVDHLEQAGTCHLEFPERSGGTS